MDIAKKQLNEGENAQEDLDVIFKQRVKPKLGSAAGDALAGKKAEKEMKVKRLDMIMRRRANPTMVKVEVEPEQRTNSTC